MIECIKIILDENGYYCLDQDLSASSINLKELGIFLVSDIGYSTLFRKWFIKEENSEGETNLYFIRKDEHKVYISSLFEKKEDNACEFSKSEFLNILDEWEKVCKEKPKEVIITEENGRYEFEKKF